MLSGTNRGPLYPQDFTLHGFDQLQAALRQALQRVHIRHGQPQVVTVEDAIFVPARKVGLHLFEGALLTSDGRPIPQALAQRRQSRLGDLVLGALREPVAVSPERVVEEVVVYLGWCFDHFGHFLLESLARTWILPQLDPTIKVVFHRERPTEPAGAARQMLALLGITLDRLLFLDAQTRLRRVIVPEPLYEVATGAHARMPEPYRQIASQIAPADRPVEQPVYLSRRLLSSRQRPLIGEFELEEVLRENGFLITHPETMSLADQVRLVNRHRTIITSAGSAAYLVLFALRSPHLHLLTADIPFPDYFLIPKLADIEASFVNCLGAGSRPFGHALPLLVDFAAVIGYLEDQGLLTKRRRSSLVLRNHGLQPAYDEAWFYKYVRLLDPAVRLPADIEAEATVVAATSWPLSWTLARHALRHQPERAEGLVQQFMQLAATETNIDRLVRYHDDVARNAPHILRHCSPATAHRLTDLLRDRFLIDPAHQERGRIDRRQVETME